MSDRAGAGGYVNGAGCQKANRDGRGRAEKLKRPPDQNPRILTLTLRLSASGRPYTSRPGTDTGTMAYCPIINLPVTAPPPCQRAPGAGHVVWAYYRQTC